MQVVVFVLATTLCGGALVLAFAALSEALKPKRFAGILAAASVAIARLVDDPLAKGHSTTRRGPHNDRRSVALTVCAAVLVPVSLRWSAGRRRQPPASGGSSSAHSGIEPSWLFGSWAFRPLRRVGGSRLVHSSCTQPAPARRPR
jgi:hypothetical protein